MFDTTGLTEKKSPREVIYYEDNSGVIVAKVCSTCKNAKILDDYYTHRGKFADKRSQCKECGKKYREKTKDRITERNKRWWKENPDYKQQYYIKNKEKINKQTKDYYENNKDELNEHYKKYREEHKDKISEYKKNYAKENKDKIREYKKQHYEANKDKINEINRKYKVENPEVTALLNEKRRTLKMLLPVTLSSDMIPNMYSEQYGECILTRVTEGLDLEHFIPLSIGHGGTTYENCYYMEHSLNMSKNNRNPFEWVNTQPDEIQERFHSILVPMLAERNEMTVEEFTDYVNWCFENPRTLEELKEATM